MECAGNGRARLEPRPASQPWLLEAVGTGRWRGVPLRSLLEEAGVLAGAQEVVFAGLDHGIENGVEQDYARSLPLEEARRGDVLLAYELNGVPLPPQHGFPLRLLVPGWYGMASVKWLDRITLIDFEFCGYHQRENYCLRQQPGDEGVPLSRMQPRSLLIPPGIPDSGSRARTLLPGPVTVRGRAWSGQGEIVRVEASADGGATWDDARLGPSGSRYAWRAWEWDWDAQPGEHELCCRASDGAGNVQPLEPPWNLGGYINNEVQRVPVTVVSELDV